MTASIEHSWLFLVQMYVEENKNTGPILCLKHNISTWTSKVFDVVHRPFQNIWKKMMVKHVEYFLLIAKDIWQYLLVTQRMTVTQIEFISVKQQILFRSWTKIKYSFVQSSSSEI